jgi:hypothetical protein
MLGFRQSNRGNGGWFIPLRYIALFVSFHVWQTSVTDSTTCIFWILDTSQAGVTTVIAVALLAACFACARGFVLGGDRITSRLVPVLLLMQVRVWS